MKHLITGACLALLVTATSAQEQQAGNAASTDTEGTFQKLVDACDDVDALMLRARIRLQLPRTTEAAAAEANRLLQAGFATCASGDLDGAKATLRKALDVAEVGAVERLTAESAPATAAVSTVAGNDAPDSDNKPWWKLW